MKLLGVTGRLVLFGGNNYNFDLRGFGTTTDSNQVVIVDGWRMNEADQSSSGLSSIAIASVTRIEILRGTGAVLLGEDANGGVIVVTTKAGTPVQRVNSAQLYGSVGSNGLRELRSHTVIASGGIGLDVSANERRSDGHRENFAFSPDSLSATGQSGNDWLRLGVRAGRSNLDTGFSGALTAAQYAANPYPAQSTTAHGSIKTRFSTGWRTEKIQKAESHSATNLKNYQNVWKLGVNQAVATNTTVYAREGRSFRLANVDEFPFTTPGVPWQTQTSRDMALGSRWTLAQSQVNAVLRKATFTEGVYAGKNLALGMANAANHKYYTQAYGCDTATGVTQSIYPEAGRAVTVSLRYKF